MGPRSNERTALMIIFTVQFKHSDPPGDTLQDKRPTWEDVRHALARMPALKDYEDSVDDILWVLEDNWPAMFRENN